MENKTFQEIMMDLNESLQKWCEKWGKYFEQEKEVDNKIIEASLNEIKRLQKNDEEVDFERLLEQAGYEIECRFYYLDEQLREIDDEILDTARIIEELKVDFDVLNAMEYASDSEITLLKLEIDRQEKRLEFLEEKQEVLTDLYDEVYCNVMI